MDYWIIGSPIYEHYRNLFKLTPEEAKERWFAKPFRERWGFSMNKVWDKINKYGLARDWVQLADIEMSVHGLKERPRDALIYARYVFQMPNETWHISLAGRKVLHQLPTHYILECRTGLHTGPGLFPDTLFPMPQWPHESDMA